MQQLRIRPKTLRRVIESRTPEQGGAHRVVRISDGEEPDNWVVVKMDSEIHNRVRYAVIEVMEVGAKARYAFVCPDPK